jgi:hypothetical protein
MPTERIRQPSFAGGELAEEFYGRSDLAKYAIGLRTLRNFIVKPSGACASRPGTRLAAQTKSDGKAVNLPFIFSDEDALILCFTDQAVRFYLTDPVSGLPGALESAPGVPLEVATPYLEAELARLRWAQVGDVVTLWHPKHPAMELVRTGAASWLLRQADDGPALTPPVPDFDGAVNQTQPDSAHPTKEWGWMVTAIDASGKESRPSFVLRPPATNDTHSRQAVLFSDNPVKLWWPALAGAVAYRVYRGRSGVFGWVGEAAETVIVSGTTYVRWRDDGDKPDYTRKPPRWAPVFTTPVWAPFTRYEVGDQVVNGPRVYECTGAGTSAGVGGPVGTGASITDGATTAWAPSTVYVIGNVVVSEGETYACSQGGTSKPPTVGSPPVTQIGPCAVATAIPDNTVRWDWKGLGAAATWKYVADGPAPLRYPSLGTVYEGRRTVGNSEADPGEVRFSRVDSYGDFEEYSNEPADGATSLSLASTRFEELRALVPRASALVALTSSSEWLLVGAGQGETIAPGRVAYHPLTSHGSSWTPPVEVGTSVLFVQRKGAIPRAIIFGDGGATTIDLSLFSRHLFAGRQIVRWAYAEDPWSVVWAVTDDGALLSLTFVQDQELVAWARHDLPGGFVEDVCTIPEGDEDAVYLVVNRGGHRYVERLASRKIPWDPVAKRWKVEEAICLDASLTYRGAPATHFSGLGHLEGQEVWALADGAVAGPFTVAGGAIDLPAETFPDGASLVHVGIRFDCDFGLLDAAREKQRVKAVKRIWLEVEASRGASAGRDVDHLEEWQQRTAEGDVALPLQTTTAEIALESRWGAGGAVVVRQKDPLPLTILAVTREVEYGGGP